MVLEQKYIHTSVEQILGSKVDPHLHSQLIFDKGAKINRRKTVSSMCGAGKIKYPHAKE